MDGKRVPIEFVTQEISHAILRSDIAQLRDVLATQMVLANEGIATIIAALHWSRIADGLGMADALEEGMKVPELAEMPLMPEMSQLLAARIRDAVLSLPLDSPDRP